MSYKLKKKGFRNYLLLVISAIFFGFLLSNFNLFQDSSPKLQIINGKVKKFGILNVGDSIAHYFKFKNVGTKELKILNVSTRCGCTVPTWNSEPISPGITDSIQVVYDSYKIGPFNQSITIYTNSPEKFEVVHIVGTVKDEL